MPGTFATQRAFPGLGEGPKKSESDFPDLGAAAKAPKKKKGQKMSLADFDALAGGGGGGGTYRAPGAGGCLLYTSPSPRDKRQSRMPSSA